MPNTTHAFSRLNNTFIRSAIANTDHTVSIFTHTSASCSSDGAFVKDLEERVTHSIPPVVAKPTHTQWWEAFWKQSWIVMEATGNATLDVQAKNLSQAYTLTRYLTAIQSQGSLPIHHNGGTLTWGWDGVSHQFPDARKWGGSFASVN
jgi:hypothetical protein